jgi:acetyl/propionyl-CoA carboxylase alpha subunit
MRAVTNEGELGEALAAAAREAGAAFADPRVYLEKMIQHPRHVEVQVLGDRHGTLLHLGERECSVQRRHQKVVEETPCPVMTAELRAEMTAAALAVARAVDYASAGTVEFLLDEGGRFYFLEMNTRLQVEHPVTEWVTGLDLVAAQLRVARGDPLGFAQADVTSRGHAIEVRVCAEDPAAGFLPSAGRILLLREPAGPGVRVDSGMEAGTVVPVEYDPLLAKISAWAPERTQAARRLHAALCDTVVLGPTTNLAFLQDVLAHPAFIAGETHTGFIDEHCSSWRPDAAEVDAAAAVAAIAGVALRPGAASSMGAAAPPSAWDTLGRWRLGV